MQGVASAVIRVKCLLMRSFLMKRYRWLMDRISAIIKALPKKVLENRFLVRYQIHPYSLFTQTG